MFLHDEKEDVSPSASITCLIYNKVPWKQKPQTHFFLNLLLIDLNYAIFVTNQSLG